MVLCLCRTTSVTFFGGVPYWILSNDNKPKTVENLILILLKYFVYTCRENPSKLIINLVLDCIRHVQKVEQRIASSTGKTELNMSKWKGLLSLV